MAEGEGGGEFGASHKVILLHVRQPPMYDDMDVSEDSGSDLDMSSGSENSGIDMEASFDVGMGVSVTVYEH